MARTTKKTWTPGSIEPNNGKCYFVHDLSRMTRVWDMATCPVPNKAGWRQVTLDEYVEYRKETLTIPLKRRKEMHALLYKESPCASSSSQPSPRSSKRTTPTPASKKPKAKSSTSTPKKMTTRKAPKNSCAANMVQ